MAGFDRYEQFRKDGKIEIVPFGQIAPMDTDFFENYNIHGKRLDQISYDYYGSPDYGWLIMQANPEYGSLEFRIPDGALLRIPFPLSTALNLYQQSIEEYRKINGNK